MDASNSFFLSGVTLLKDSTVLDLIEGDTCLYTPEQETSKQTENRINNLLILLKWLFSFGK